jgi:hypothetical protein
MVEAPAVIMILLEAMHQVVLVVVEVVVNLVQEPQPAARVDLQVEQVLSSAHKAWPVVVLVQQPMVKMLEQILVMPQAMVPTAKL